MDGPEPREVVKRIRREFEASRGSRIWPEYIRALNLISQVVFTRSAGFILELIQNAEDAGRGLSEPGSLEISVSPERVKITHNGRPFCERDAEALCGIRSSKKPEQGTLGYLGIGFKSVFKITDCPEVYSGGYRFKFDKHDPAWAEDPGAMPWHVTPIWLDSPSEGVDPALTTFILPFRESGAYQDLVDELRRLDTGLFLFLRWLKNVRMANEETGDESVLEHGGETPDGITVLKQGGRTERFKVFRKTVPVPARVAEDDLTRGYRAGVQRREIAIAFGVGEGGDLDPSGSSCSFGGVYSFVPLGEAKSGARYRIQADFLVQPGRDAVNYEAKWSQWLVDEIAGLSVEALSFFAEHETWRYQFLPLFQFTRAPGTDAYDALFGPRLIDPVEKELSARACLPTADGGMARVDEVVRVTEEQAALRALLSRELLPRGEIAATLGGRSGLRALHPQVVVPHSTPIPRVSRWNLLRNENFMQSKATSPDGPAWFRRLYLWLQENPWCDLLPNGDRSKLEKRYHQEAIVLGSGGRLHRGGEVLLPAGLRASPLLNELVEEETGDMPVCHPETLEGAGEVGAGGKLFGFLTGKCGVQKLDAAAVCRNWLLPRILADAPDLPVETLLEYTRVCMENLGDLRGTGAELRVLAKDGEILPAKEVLISAPYRPSQSWESMARYLPNARFLSPAYLQEPLEPDDHAAWRRFFRSAGVKTDPDNGVEEVAVNIAQELLGREYARVTPVPMRNLGYDLEVETEDGDVLRVEVKGLGGEGDVELTPNETRAADLHKEKYVLCVVSPIPHGPRVYMLHYPTGPGRGARYALRVAPEVWREARWPAEPGQ